MRNWSWLRYLRAQLVAATDEMGKNKGKRKARPAADPTASILDDISDSKKEDATAALQAAKLHPDSPAKWKACS